MDLRPMQMHCRCLSPWEDYGLINWLCARAEQLSAPIPDLWLPHWGAGADYTPCGRMWTTHTHYSFNTHTSTVCTRKSCTDAQCNKTHRHIHNMSPRYPRRYCWVHWQSNTSDVRGPELCSGTTGRCRANTKNASEGKERKQRSLGLQQEATQGCVYYASYNVIWPPHSTPIAGFP